ncbi:PhzF family phenazine biosynthesis protein [Photorhabdus laumondii]|uniref:PhzF family phenazine biosynthesis protein n=1 Tax=Photorhabdus laumondii TaxID=2218628 RepID=UPI0025AF870D|nr:PhzF family phenazine biosynthesis protein [Photorhabdus laumondii]
MSVAKIYVVNAFSGHPFSGNPAGVMLLEEDTDSDSLKRIVAESRLPEVSFIRKDEISSQYRIRWFTSQTELDICGHGTLSAAHIVFTLCEPDVNEITFLTGDKTLHVSKEANKYRMMLPAIGMVACNDPVEIAQVEAAVTPAQKIYKGRSYLLWLNSEEEVVGFIPERDKLLTLPLPGVIIAALGNTTDYVCRYFAPQKGIDEDPVTGTAHSTVASLLSRERSQTKFSASQLSQRGGEISVEVTGNNVALIGQAYTAMEINIFLSD